MSKRVDTDSEYDESSESDYDYDYDYDYDDCAQPKYRGDQEEYEELHCKNLDPALAKLMGIMIEEQKETNWKPPAKSGLDNSERIISISSSKSVDVDFFNTIKENIINYKKLTDKQLEYIKNLNNEQKFELIQLYNRMR